MGGISAIVVISYPLLSEEVTNLILSASVGLIHMW